MKTLLSILFLACIIVITGCTSQKSIVEAGKTYESMRGFEPVDPIEYDSKIQIVQGGSIVEKEIKLLTSEEILSFLNNETVLVSIAQVTAEGGISYLPVVVSARHTSYRVTMDYMKFATLAKVDEQGDFIGYKRVGVGLRLISLITTVDAGINIGDLSSIGLAAKLGQLKGTLMIEVVGIKSKEVTTLLPLPSEINQTTIQNAMQALAAIKSKIYDPETRLYPQVMATKVDDSVVAKALPVDSKSKIGKRMIDSLIANTKAKLLSDDRSSPMDINSQAKSLEEKAFEYMFQKNVDEAIKTFDACEAVFPQYHSVYEISKLIKKERAALLDRESVKWTEVYRQILTDYSWKLSPSIINELKRLTQ